MAGLAAAVRGRDGRGPRTELERTIPAAVGLKRPDAVTHAFYARRLDDRHVGDLAPTVFATAAAGDPVARSIIDRLADELTGMAAALARRTNLVRRDPDVVLGGGVFRTDDEAFHERLRDGVRDAIPAARIVRLAAPPVLGAALLGLDRLAARGADGDDPGIAGDARNGTPAHAATHAAPARAVERARSGFDAWSATVRVAMPS
jgi:N-acetylglucosamine kinase-like BadF-type ATPase